MTLGSIPHLAVVVAAVFLVTSEGVASPVTSVWLGGAGVWSDPSKWLAGSGIPNEGYQVLVQNTEDPSRVTVDVVTPALNNLAIASQGHVAIDGGLTAGNIQSFGGLVVNSGGTLNIGADGFVQDGAFAATTVMQGAVVVDSGTWSQGAGSLAVGGTLATPLFHVTGGSVTAGSGGWLAVGSGGYTQDGAVSTRVESGGRLTVDGAYGQGNGSTQVEGLLSASLFHVTGGTVGVGSGGTVLVGGDGYIQGNATTTLSRHGLLVVSGGDFSQEIGTTTHLDGTLTANNLNNSGLVDGSGSLRGNLVNRGTLSPGDGQPGARTPGIFSVSGDYAQSGFLDIDIAGEGANDLLRIGGTASFDGTLDIALDAGFVPSDGARFMIATYTASAGTFYNVFGTGLPEGDRWLAIYDPDALYVQFVSVTNSVPEASSGVLLVLGLLASGLASRRGLRRG